MLLVTLVDPSDRELEEAIHILDGDQSSMSNVHCIRDANHVSLVARVVNGEGGQVQDALAGLHSLKDIRCINTPYVLSARDARAERSVVELSPDVRFGGKEFTVIAGPCSVESHEQTLSVARAVKQVGARALRGGAFKPRTSPFSFQGLKHEGLEILQKVRAETGLPVVSELLGQRELHAVDESVDAIQIGMRNGLNYMLLKDVGRLASQRPVLLKCGIGTSLDEFLCAADYILEGGNPNVILCLRGTIGFSTETRSSMNVADIPALRRRTHLPIVVDPSHVAGRWDLVPAIAAAALVGGADGLLVEVHDKPKQALSDGDQSLLPERFHRMMHRLRLLAPILGRSVTDCQSPAFHDQGHPMNDFCMEEPASSFNENSLYDIACASHGAKEVYRETT